MDHGAIRARAKRAYADLIYSHAGGASGLFKAWEELAPHEQERFLGPAKIEMAREEATRSAPGSAIAVLMSELDRVSKDHKELMTASDESFSACMSAWSCGEPSHRVKTMLDRTEELGKVLRRLKGW